MSDGGETVSMGGDLASGQELAPTLGRQPDTEITLRSMPVYLPEEPVSINGRLYEVTLDEARLAAAVNVAVNYGASRYSGRLNPTRLVVGLNPGEAVLALGEDSLPEILETDGENSKPLLSYRGKGKGTAINLTVPQTLESSEFSADGIAKLATRSLNGDLLTALEQIRNSKRKHRWGLKLGSIAAAMATGEGIGIATAESSVSMAERGIYGAVVAGIVTAAAIGAKGDIQAWRAGDADSRGYTRWAIKKARSQVKDAHNRRQFREIYREEPIISLKAVKQAENL